MSNLRFYGHMMALRTARDLYVLLYLGLTGGFAWLDRHQLRERGR